MAIGCFVWRVTFGENTIRRGSASPYSQGRKLADTRLVGSCQVTWFHLIAVPWEVVGIYAKCQGRKLQVWSWPYSGESNLGCVPSSIIFESGCSGDHSWHFPVDKGRCRPHEGSSEWSYLENQIVTSWLILINDKRRVAAGRHFLRTWHGTWVLQRRTRSFLTWQSRPGQTKCLSMSWVHVFGNRDGTLLRAHKLVLASQTSYFEGLFRQENPGQVIGHIFSCSDCRTVTYSLSQFWPRKILDTCDLWDICSEWWENMTWPTKDKEKDQYK